MTTPAAPSTAPSSFSPVLDDLSSGQVVARFLPISIEAPVPVVEGERVFTHKEDTEDALEMNRDDARREILSNTDRSGACWLWTAATVRGYGTFRFRGKSRLAHRVSWQVVFGSIPDGLDVLHKCDTPACVNPDHLFLGDDGANARDKFAKGRHPGTLAEREIDAATGAFGVDMTVMVECLERHGFDVGLVFRADGTVDETCVHVQRREPLSLQTWTLRRRRVGVRWFGRPTREDAAESRTDRLWDLGFDGTDLARALLGGAQ